MALERKDVDSKYKWDLSAIYKDEAAFYEDYAKAEVLTAENATGIVNGTTVSGIAAKDLDSTIYVAGVYESNGVCYCTGVLPYSVGAFCASNGSALAQAIAVYGYYAEAYFG